MRGRDGALRRALAAPPTCEQLLGAVARDAVDLLTDPAARARLRRCEGEACPLVHLDSSRGGRRRWCSSETCGNRERAVRHRRRTAGERRPVPHRRRPPVPRRPPYGVPGVRAGSGVGYGARLPRGNPHAVACVALRAASRGERTARGRDEHMQKGVLA
nr:CGNR zinc finger domain-containing protein [Streptomyces sp. SCUT-3]